MKVEDLLGVPDSGSSTWRMIVGGMGVDTMKLSGMQCS